jgi:hypothetical protein
MFLAINAYPQNETHSFYAGVGVESCPLSSYIFGYRIPELQADLGYRQNINRKWAFDVGLAGVRGYYLNEWSTQLQDIININVEYRGGGIFPSLNYMFTEGKRINVYAGVFTGGSFLFYNEHLIGEFSGEDNTWKGNQRTFCAGPSLGFNIDLGQAGFLKLEADAGTAYEHHHDVIQSYIGNPPIASDYIGSHYYFYFRPQAALGFRF